MPNLNDVCKRSGISYRQADHWIREDYVQIEDKNTGSGFRREVSLQELPQFLILGQLLKHGFSLQTARRLLPKFLASGFTDGDHIRINFTIERPSHESS